MHLTTQSCWQEFAQAGAGVWYSRSASATGFSAAAGVRIPARSNEYTLENVRLNPEFIPDVTFPAGARVRVVRDGKIVREFIQPAHAHDEAAQCDRLPVGKRGIPISKRRRLQSAQDCRRQRELSIETRVHEELDFLLGIGAVQETQVDTRRQPLRNKTVNHDRSGERVEPRWYAVGLPTRTPNKTASGRRA
ncbi:MAG TPA: hypothetical protein VML55_22555, partial [Planctomycetaceae bacterium]|nr:hypothetical protein [Planctomycetaceae bacterium]